MSRWLRRREIWWPTASGWAVLLLLLAALVVALGLSIQALLAPEAPARGPDGRGAQTVIVEGWLSEAELAQAVETIRKGPYRRVLTSGGPIEPENDAGHWHNFAVRAASYLQTHLPPDIPVTPVPAPDTLRDRTYLSALTVRDWARGVQLPMTTFDVYTAGAHGRRSRLLYQMAFGEGAEVGVLTARPRDFDAARWWASSSGAKAVLGEVISLGWTKCCFWPGDPG